VIGQKTKDKRLKNTSDQRQKTKKHVIARKPSEARLTKQSKSTAAEHAIKMIILLR